MPSAKSAAHRPLPVDLGAALGEVVHQLRTEQVLTQEALASRSQVSVQLVRRLEAGTSNPTLGTLHAITRALGTSVADLLSRAGI